MDTCWYILGVCWCNVVYVLTSLSAVGNIITVAIILHSDKLRQRSTFIILIFLALSDFLMMASLSVFCVVEDPFLMEMKSLKMKCLLRNLEHWFNSSSLYLSYIFILLVAVERFAVVHFVFRGPHMFSRKNVLIACTCILILVFSSNIYLFWFQFPNYKYFDCDFQPTFTSIKHYSYYIITSGTWILMVILDVSIMWKLRQNAAANRELRHGRTLEASQKYANTHVMLVCTMGAFLLLVGPFLVTEIIYVNGGDSLIGPVTREVLFFLNKLNHCINFFLYVVSCRMFRSRVCELFGAGKCRKQDETSRRQSGTELLTI